MPRPQSSSKPTSDQIKQTCNSHPIDASDLLFTGVIKCILLDRPYVILLVSLQQPCSRGVERIIRVRVIKKTTNRKEYLGNSEHRGPLLLQNVQADNPVLRDVRMKYLRLKGHFRWLERVIRWEAYVQVENTRFIGRVLGAQDTCPPYGYIISYWAPGAIHRRVFLEFLELLLNAFLCHFAIPAVFSYTELFIICYFT